MIPTPPQDEAWNALGDHWDIAPGVTYLNHGSFGPPTRAVVEARAEWQRRLASNPMAYLSRGIEQDRYLGEARAALGGLVGCSADDLAFVENSTVGMNIVAKSFPLQAGDRVLATDHEYGAVLRLWEETCRAAGAELVVQPLPFPLNDADEIVQAVFAGADARTKLLVVSHVTSPTAVVLPIDLDS